MIPGGRGFPTLCGRTLSAILRLFALNHREKTRKIIQFGKKTLNDRFNSLYDVKERISKNISN